MCKVVEVEGWGCCISSCDVFVGVFWFVERRLKRIKFRMMWDIIKYKYNLESKCQVKIKINNRSFHNNKMYNAIN